MAILAKNLGLNFLEVDVTADWYKLGINFVWWSYRGIVGLSLCKKNLNSSSKYMGTEQLKKNKNGSKTAKNQLFMRSKLHI